jgi:hypothetical protein
MQHRRISKLHLLLYKPPLLNYSSKIKNTFDYEPNPHTYTLQPPAFTTTSDNMVAHLTCLGFPGSIISHGVAKLVFIET